MAEPVGQQNTTSLSWRVRVCHASWKVLLFVWGTLVLGILVNVGSSWLITKNFDLVGTPLGWGMDHLWVMLFLLFLLAMLTLLSWLGSHEKRVILAHRRSQQDRVHMLKRLRLYYEQIRSQSLQGAVQVELGLAERPAAIQNALSLSLHLPNPPEQLLPPHTSIIQAYEQAQQELLILGEPGAGKSTLLLKLAQHLVELAEQDATQPLPVLLPLSSWATKHPPLHDWLVEQVALLYKVSKGLSQQWLQDEQLLPLLDGLDEVEASQRAACIAAINTYHHEHLQPLVVCSRISEYEAAAMKARLALHGAVVVQPLSKEQVDTYLVNLGKPLEALHAAMRRNPVLQELATTPLMLQVLILTYHGTSVWELSHKEAQLRKQIWDDYLQRMVSGKGDERRYPLRRTVAWLSWLARQMREHNQAIFFLELIQPSWLPKGQRVFYRWSIVLIFGLIFGLVGGLLSQLGNGLGGGLLTGLLTGLLIGLLIGLPVGRVFIFSDLKNRLSIGLFTGLMLMLFCWLLIGLPLGLVGGLLVWSGGGLLTGLLFGLVSGPLVCLFAVLLEYEYSGHLDELPTKDGRFAQNEGIRGSVKDGLIAGLVGGLFTGLIAGLVGGLFAGLVGGLIFGLIFGVVSGLIFGVVGGLFSVVKHYILRLCLSRTHLFPWRAAHFLEDATARILLRRVGGGYQFTHRLLLDYFADLNAHPSLLPMAESSTPSPTP